MVRNVKPELDIEFVNEVVDKDNQVKFLKQGDKYLFRNRIYAKGGDIDKVREITYVVHPSFPDPIRRVRDRGSNFELIIWAWGEFTIKTIITTTDKKEHYKDFDLKFGDKLREAERRKDVKVVEESPK